MNEKDKSLIIVLSIFVVLGAFTAVDRAIFTSPEKQTETAATLPSTQQVRLDSIMAEIQAELEVKQAEEDSLRAYRRAAKKVDRQFSWWDGSHEGLVKRVKKTLNDPNSFEHLETTRDLRWGWPHTFRVRMEYTVKNMYGGRVRYYVIALVEVNSGEIVRIVRKGRTVSE